MEIAVISGKGGTGKSSISAAFATLEQQVVLADCDVDAANLYLIFNPSHDEETVYIGGYTAVVDHEKCDLCGLCSSYCRFDAIDTIGGKISISEISCEGCFLCARICPQQAVEMKASDRSRMYAGDFRNGKMVYGRLAPGEENSGKLVSLVREKARELARAHHCKNIIIDGPPGIGCPVISTISGVGTVVIVTEPSVSGFSDLKRAVDIVRKFDLSPWVIVNKYNMNRDITLQIKRWCNENMIRIAGYLPFTLQMVHAMMHQQSIIEFNRNLKISKLLKTIYSNIMHEA